MQACRDQPGRGRPVRPFDLEGPLADPSIEHQPAIAPDRSDSDSDVQSLRCVPGLSRSASCLTNAVGLAGIRCAPRTRPVCVRNGPRRRQHRGERRGGPLPGWRRQRQGSDSRSVGSTPRTEASANAHLPRRCVENDGTSTRSKPRLKSGSTVRRLPAAAGCDRRVGSKPSTSSPRCSACTRTSSAR